MNTPLRQRAVELGLALAARHRVLILVAERQAPGLSLARKLLWHLRQALTYSSQAFGGGAVTVRLPALPRWPRASCVYQSTILSLVAWAWRCDAVLTESTAEVRAPVRPERTVVFDLPDDHAAGWERDRRPEVAASIRAFIGQEIAKASAVTASSRPLCDLVRREYGRDAVLVPNGARVAECRRVSGDAVVALRQRLGIGPGPVLGFTGGLDGWLDVRLLLDAFEIVRRSRRDATLLLVGDGAKASEFRRAGSEVLVTGFVPADAVAAHVAIFDVGLIPFVRSALTDAMLPIKLFDYGAARRPAVATPLAAYDGEDVPFLTLTRAEAGPFAAAILAAIARGWDPAWDASVDRYDWARLALPMEALLAGRHR